MFYPSKFPTFDWYCLSWSVHFLLWVLPKIGLPTGVAGTFLPSWVRRISQRGGEMAWDGKAPWCVCVCVCVCGVGAWFGGSYHFYSFLNSYGCYLSYMGIRYFFNTWHVFGAGWLGPTSISFFDSKHLQGSTRAAPWLVSRVNSPWLLSHLC